jgi:hypothetical protein
MVLALTRHSYLSKLFPEQHSVYHWAPLWIAALAVTLLFVGHDPRRLWAPFGPSHDGFNAALYMTGGRAIVEEGPLASKLGASSGTLSGDRVVYAHHPPLVYLEDAVALVVFRSPEIAARLPALVSSIVVVVLLVLVLAACGLPPGSAALGLLIAFATPMFMSFGAVTEPHALGLAPTAALTLLWQRIRLGSEPPSWTLGSVAALAVLTSWDAALFAVSVAVFLWIGNRRRAAIVVLIGVTASSLLVAVWILWAYHGDLSEFFQRALHRVGAGDTGRVTLWQATRRQIGYFSDLFPVGKWLVVLVAALGLLDRRTSPLVGASLGTVLGYALLFRNGAYDHGYWLYCILLPLALGAAVAVDTVSRLLASISWLRWTRPALAAGLIVVLGIKVWRPSDEQNHQRYAAVIGAEARSVRWPPTELYAYHAFGGGGGPTDILPWVLFYSRRQPFGVEGPQSVPRGEVVLRMVNGQLVSVPGEKTGP